MNMVGVIPARYSSTRLSGKPLIKIKGKFLIQRVWEQAVKAKKLTRVIVATDDRRIFKVAKNFGAEVMITPKNCPSGTTRIAAVAKRIKGDVFINIQGDEPLLSPITIDRIASVFLNDKEVLCSTAIYEMKDKDFIENPNVVKVVIDKDSDALYFSRSVIPYYRDSDASDIKVKFYKHIGIYGYTKKFLLKLDSLKSPDIEKIEKLEQLKILWHGYKIKCVKANYDSIGVDTPSDVLRVSAQLLRPLVNRGGA